LQNSQSAYKLKKVFLSFILKIDFMKYLFIFLLIPTTIFAQRDSVFYKMSAIDFMKISEVNQPIDAKKPNQTLFDAALFHATNEQRVKFNLPIFQYSLLLYKAAIGHSEAMIEQDFYNHDNPYSPAHRSMQDRILLYTYEFKRMAENIAQQDIIGGTDNLYCFQNPKFGEDYVFVSCDKKKAIPMRTYSELARAVVNGWMNSPHHRENILNPKLIAMGCSGRFSKNPFKTSKSPFARLTQDFGGGF
jgi:uncharacterized protein YkwD